MSAKNRKTAAASSAGAGSTAKSKPARRPDAGSPARSVLVGAGLLIGGMVLGWLLFGGAESEAPDFGPAEGETSIARIGGEFVTAEEVYFGYNQLNVQRPIPLESFLTAYLDQVMFAGEARRLNVLPDRERNPSLRYYERSHLSQAYLRSLRPNVTEREIQEHYIENLQRWWNPDAARIQHIFVDDPAKAAAVRSELNEGRPFVEVAERHSLDFAKLPNGVDIEEEVVAGQAYIPFIGMADPNLAQKLTLLPEGATTGPLQSARGIHWVRIAEKREGAPEPLENIREEVRAELERSLFEAAVREAGARIKERLSRENDYEVFADRLPRPTPRGGVILQSTPEGPP